jgi:hypothetical protein
VGEPLAAVLDPLCQLRQLDPGQVFLEGRVGGRLARLTAAYVGAVSRSSDRRGLPELALNRRLRCRISCWG